MDSAWIKLKNAEEDVSPREEAALMAKKRTKMDSALIKLLKLVIKKNLPNKMMKKEDAEDTEDVLPAATDTDFHLNFF